MTSKQNLNSPANNPVNPSSFLGMQQLLQAITLFCCLGNSTLRSTLPQGIKDSRQAPPTMSVERCPGEGQAEACSSNVEFSKPRMSVHHVKEVQVLLTQWPGSPKHCFSCVYWLHHGYAQKESQHMTICLIFPTNYGAHAFKIPKCIQLFSLHNLFWEMLFLHTRFGRVSGLQLTLQWLCIPICPLAQSAPPQSLGGNAWREPFHCSRGIVRHTRRNGTNLSLFLHYYRLDPELVSNMHHWAFCYLLH